MNEKIMNYFEGVNVDILHIAQSFANDNKSPQIEPAHLFRALLHKSAGLINFIEDTLDEDYYYLLDWCDIRMQQCEKSAYGMKGIKLSDDCQSVIKEAISLQAGYDTTLHKLEFILAALVSPGVGFSADQLKTMPLKAEKVLSQLHDGNPDTVRTAKRVSTQSNISANISNDYCFPLLDDACRHKIIGFEKTIRSVIEILARKDRANILIVGETGTGKTSLIHGLLNLALDKKLPASISHMEPYELDLISFSQGISYKGEIEDRFKSVIEFLSTKEQPILIIENFHRIEDKQSMLHAILPNLTRLLSTSTVQFICTTTVDGFTKDVEKDKELV